MNRLFVNGKFYAIQKGPQAPYYEAMWVQDGRIRQLGDISTLREQAGGAAEIDLAGNAVLPAFTDAHLHFLSFGLGLTQLQLEGCSCPQLLDKVSEAASLTANGEWIIGRGFNFNDWPEGWPKKEWLDKITTSHPIVLTAKDGHMIWVNSRAYQEVGITKDTTSPSGGVIEHDQAGELTGIIKERAINLVIDKLPKPSPRASEIALARAIKQAHAFGITAVHNLEEPLTWRALQSLRAKAGLNLRFWMTFPVDQLAEVQALGLAVGFGDEYLRLGGIKIFADGSLGSRTAWMLQPYQHSESLGVQVTTKDQLKALVAASNQANLPVAVHAIGDGAVRAALDAIEDEGNPGLRNRIEHAQLIDPSDVNRFSRLNVIASMQPTQCPQDRYMAEEYWGERCGGAYPFRALLASGARLAFGSDSPVESCDVLLGLYSAVARKRFDEPDSSPWYPSEAVSMYEAVRAYTIDAAYAGGEEGYRGDLMPGKVGDFVVLNQDILAAKDPEILKETKIVATYFNGEQVYSG